MPIEIVAAKAMWRAGARHPAGAQEYPEGHFTAAQLKRIAADPNFTVHAKGAAEKPPAAPKGAAGRGGGKKEAAPPPVGEGKKEAAAPPPGGGDPPAGSAPNSNGAPGDQQGTQPTGAGAT